MTMSLRSGSLTYLVLLLQLHAFVCFCPYVLRYQCQYNTKQLQQKRGSCVNSFNKFVDIPDWLLENCDKLGFKEPTSAQEESLPLILGGKDVILQSQTGSGKTLSFALPILSKIDASRAAVQAVVVVPTRELGLQVTTVLKQLASGSPEKIMIMSLVEGSKNRRQMIWATAEPPHIVVGNPRALQRLVDLGRLRLNAVSFVVLDEVDACLIEPDTRQELHKLLSRHLSSTYQNSDDELDQEQLDRGAGDLMRQSRVYKDLTTKTQLASMGKGDKYRMQRQTIMCSATIPQRQHFANTCYKNGWTTAVPELIHVSPPQQQQREQQQQQEGEDTTSSADTDSDSHYDTRGGSGGAGGGGAGRPLVPAQVIHQHIPCSADMRVPVMAYVLRAKLKSFLKRRASSSSDDGDFFSSFHAIVFVDMRYKDEIDGYVAAIHGAVNKVLSSHDNDNPSSSSSSSSSAGSDGNSNSSGSGSGSNESDDKQALEYRYTGAEVGVLIDSMDIEKRGQALDVFRQGGGGGGSRGVAQYTDMDQCAEEREDSSDGGGGSMHEVRASCPPAVRVLVCSDLAARGLDIPSTSLVIQMNLPSRVEDYMHRAGRTGRLNRGGMVVTLTHKEEQFVVDRYSNEIGVPISLRKLKMKTNE